MRVVRRHDRTDAATIGSGWDARFRRVATGVGLLGLLLLPAGAWAESPDVVNANMTTIAPISVAGAMPTGAMLVSATPISDGELATEVAKGLPKPGLSEAPAVQQPVVILWDEVDRPGSLSGMGNAAGVETSTSWH